nr:MAG TPA: hypothetical protein [Caudoviricetes sp.]
MVRYFFNHIRTVTFSNIHDVSINLMFNISLVSSHGPLAKVFIKSSSNWSCTT